MNALIKTISISPREHTKAYRYSSLHFTRVLSQPSTICATPALPLISTPLPGSPPQSGLPSDTGLFAETSVEGSHGHKKRAELSSPGSGSQVYLWNGPSRCPGAGRLKIDTASVYPSSRQTNVGLPISTSHL